ncbi:MAG: tetratricopeptide repeat protein, partial [Rhodospirillales bacterium]|nr:tetratricopeptide repeat protein [Rhodospirillales bacterium]
MASTDSFDVTTFQHLLAVGRLSEAAEQVRQSLTQAPEDPDLLHAASIVCVQSGRLAEAAEWIGRALARRPDSPEFLNSRGAVAYGLGRMEEAEAAFRQALTLAPRDAVAWNNLGNTLKS